MFMTWATTSLPTTAWTASTGSSDSWTATGAIDYLLMEDGGYLLQEGLNKIIVDPSVYSLYTGISPAEQSWANITAPTTIWA